jgi:hypothetical protein
MNLLLLAAATAFNLACAGTLTTSDLNGTRTKPYSSEYRIDLAKGRWCESECKATHPVIEAQPAFIELEHKEANGPTEVSSLTSMVNRQTGEHTAELQHPRLFLVLDVVRQLVRVIGEQPEVVGIDLRSCCAAEAKPPMTVCAIRISARWSPHGSSE